MIIIAVLLLLIALVLFAGKRSTHGRLQQRVAYWESVVDREIPAGSTKEHVEQWARQRQIQSIGWDRNQNMLNVRLEKIPERIKFPCSHWSIMLEVYLDNDSRAVKKHIWTAGSCV